ncbi:unnamed protein product [Sphenostylis stenocarpa]|uniref:Uncharacterized protein n=1 Tax=Sphenostylis stenocarpa TaxID=92480 RepID=A0AA86VHN3_9FABA|nr:unnamed protein product [Sphenostylis stenocarpa]
MDLSSDSSSFFGVDSTLLLQSQSQPQRHQKLQDSDQNNYALHNLGSQMDGGRRSDLLLDVYWICSVVRDGQNVKKLKAETIVCGGIECKNGVAGKKVNARTVKEDRVPRRRFTAELPAQNLILSLSAFKLIPVTVQGKNNAELSMTLES